MANTNGILAVFAASPPPEHSAVPDYSGNDDEGFKNYLDDVVKSAPSVQENRKPSSEKRDTNIPANPQRREVDRTEKFSVQEPATKSREQQANAEVGLNETTPVNTQTDNNELDLEKLKSTKFDQEKLNALMDILDKVEDADANDILQSLLDVLSMNQINDPAISGQKQITAQDLMALVNDKKNQASDILAKIGITDQQVKSLVDKIQPALNKQPSLQDAINDKARSQTIGQNQNKEDASLQLSKEALAKAASKNNAEGEVKSKPDIMTRFDLKQAKQGETSDREAPIKKLIDQTNRSAKSIATEETGDKTGSQSTPFKDFVGDDRAKAHLIQTAKLANGVSMKGPEGVKTGPDIQIQSISTATENTSKTTESFKSMFPEALNSRGTQETKVIQQIINNFSVRSNGNQNEIKLRLDPPSLGTVRMSVSTSGESVRTLIIAENPMVKQIIENNISQLRDSFASQGMKMESVSVHVGGDSNQNSSQDPKHKDLGYSHYYSEEETAFFENYDTTPKRSFITLDESQTFSVMA